MRPITLAIVLLFAVVLVAAKAERRAPLYEWVRHPKEWVHVGRAPADQSHKLAIALPTANYVQLEEKFWAISDPESPSYRKFMSIKEIEQLVDPGVEVTGPVLAWLKSERAAKVSLHGDFIKLEAPVSAIERLFATEMHVFKHYHTGKSVIRHMGQTSIPSSAARHVQLVEGLHEFPRVKAFKVGTPMVSLGEQAPAGPFPFVSNNVPQSLWTLYNIPNNTLVTNPKATQGVFAQQAADGIPQLTDLAAFDQAVGIPVQTYTYNGVNDTQTGGEASLDLQMITSIAQNANTTFFMQQAWMYMFTTDLLSLGEAAPLVISVSYGWAEAQECSDVLHDIKVCKSHGWNSQQYINNTDIQFMKFGASGRTFVVCSQDEGAPGETNDDCTLDNKLALYPEYPASSPYVTTVGATAILGSGNNIGSSAPSQVLLSGNNKRQQAPSLLPPCQRYNCTRGPQTELPCYLQNAIFTTGGGFSQVEPQPSYQQAAVAHYLASNITIPPSTKFNRTNRGYPDIGAIGQNVLIVMGGVWQVTGGTSASTPIVAGVFTLINNWLLNQGKPQLGFVNPLLYRMAAQQPNTFNQVTQGANRCTESACCTYGFEANPDGTWNPATGLGSPNYLNILSYLQKNNL